ncbi:type II secretion system protein N [Croceicoccus bisphenolivorans]|uniref:type II secretion system protein N n=1 Tax=Croceicoccus bisphenolivorans TaxID=1783232 RepID=UPI000830CCAF|nr:type II secretion system protein N [Croceicoccus bisphenolivorans]
MIGRWIFIRDGRLSRTTKIVLLLLVLLTLVATLPLRLALGAANTTGSLSAQEVDGIIWSGAAGDLQAGTLPLGSLYVGLKPLPLLLARAEFALDRPAMPGEAEFHALARGGEGWVAIREANGELSLAGRMAPLPVRAITFADFAMESRAGRCVEASGNLGIIVSSLGPMLPAETLMSGPARCEDGALVVPMQGPSGTEHLHFTLVPDSTWHADLVLKGLPVEVSAPLLDMGFTGRPEGVGLSASGTL